MKIDNNGLSSSGVTARELGSKGPDRTQRSADQTGTSRVDDVDLSASARLLGELRASVKAEPAIDQERVNDIRSRIAEGTYHVDPERLANSFLELESILDQ